MRKHTPQILFLLVRASQDIKLGFSLFPVGRTTDAAHLYLAISTQP